MSDRVRHVERGILCAVAYADVFDYPLTLEEVHRYLVGARATLSEVRDALNGGSLVPRRLARRGPFYALPGREGIVELRRRRAAAAARIWPDAARYGKILSGLPFVRMVAVTGSLAAGNVEPGADIDYLIVTEPGRLWLCRALVILQVRAARRRRVLLCPNYLLSESALELEERDLYTAWELSQMVPVSGLETYHRLRERNGWIASFLPNAGDRPRSRAENLQPYTERKSAPWRMLEGVLRTPVGDWIEEWERERKVRRFTRMSGLGGDGLGTADVDADFSATRCKGHLGTRAREIMARYRERIAELEMSGS